MTLTDGTASRLPELLGPGSHGTTFGGTPLGCAVSLETLATIEEEGLLANSLERGQQAQSALRAAGVAAIGTVRGHGLMIGVELDPEAIASLPGFQKNPDRSPSLKLVDRCQENGLLLVPSGTARVRWLPPLNVTAEEITQGVTIFTKTLREMELH